jgi:hypothetical protein
MASQGWIGPAEKGTKMNATTTTETADFTRIGHYYEPLPYYGGKVMKYAGIACQMNKGFMMAKPGMIMLRSYIADRIKADTNEPFASL